RNEELDLAIRYCLPEAAPADAARLFGETVAPVAHPALGLSALRSPEELSQHVLLEFDGEYRPWLRWNEWLTSQGWDRFKPKATLRVNHSGRAIQAGIAGQGIALGRLELIGPALADRRLVKVCVPRPGPATTNAYWLIRSASTARPEVNDVAAWIRAEASS